MDLSKITIETLNVNYIDEIISLWNAQYNKIINMYNFLSDGWKNDNNIKQFITNHIRNENSIIIRYFNNIVGYMTYDMFNFHNERTAFFPILAHTAEEKYKTTIYRIMYSNISEKLVKQGCLNHLCTFFAFDERLKQYL